MEYDFPKSRLYKSIMTALFVGIVVTLLCLVYNYFYRNSTGYNLSSIINIASIIFGVNLLFLVVGTIYYLLTNLVNKGEIVFIVLMVVLTVVLSWRSELAHRTADAVLNREFRGLLTGDVVIIGLCASFLLPFLYHNRKFEEKVI